MQIPLFLELLSTTHPSRTWTPLFGWIQAVPLLWPPAPSQGLESKCPTIHHPEGPWGVSPSDPCPPLVSTWEYPGEGWGRRGRSTWLTMTLPPTGSPSSLTHHIPTVGDLDFPAPPRRSRRPSPLATRLPPSRRASPPLRTSPHPQTHIFYCFGFSRNSKHWRKIFYFFSLQNHSCHILRNIL